MFGCLATIASKIIVLFLIIGAIIFTAIKICDCLTIASNIANIGMFFLALGTIIFAATQWSNYKKEEKIRVIERYITILKTYSDYFEAFDKELTHSIKTKDKKIKTIIEEFKIPYNELINLINENKNNDNLNNELPKVSLNKHFLNVINDLSFLILDVEKGKIKYTEVDGKLKFYKIFDTLELINALIKLMIKYTEK